MLDLSETDIGDKGMEFLSECNFKLLSRFYLHSTLIGKQGIKYLARCDFNLLELLSLEMTKIAEDEKIEIKKRLIILFPKLASGAFYI